MKRFSIVFFMVVVIHSICMAQELKVSDFHEDVGRLDAVREPVKDLNGTPCGLIRLGLVHSSVEFEGYIMKSEYRNCEWYVWMAKDAKYIVIKATGYPPLHYDFDEPLKSKTTYIMTVTKPFSENKTKAISYIVPGLGQIELGNKTEGYATIIGETLLLGSGIISNISANNQLKIMRDVDVSLENYMSAKSKYTTFQAVNVTCYVAAVALYGFHLYRVYHLSKVAKSKEYTSLIPTIITTEESLSLGLSLNLKF